MGAERRKPRSAYGRNLRGRARPLRRPDLASRTHQSKPPATTSPWPSSSIPSNRGREQWQHDFTHQRHRVQGEPWGPGSKVRTSFEDAHWFSKVRILENPDDSFEGAHPFPRCALKTAHLRRNRATRSSRPSSPARPSRGRRESLGNRRDGSYTQALLA
jgi:hypothetical protein